MRPLKFAITREDPELELEVLSRFGLTRPLLVASGGCTLLEVKARRPELEVTGYDFNPTQLEHVRTKIKAVAARDLRALNVDDDAPQGLNQSGDFEALFRLWREALHAFIATPEEVEAFFVEDHHGERITRLCHWRDNPYWPRTFELAFHHPLLDTMFGPEATQHAEPGSYPAYFERVFVRGLSAPGAARNPFLQHILLGRWLPQDAPSHVWAGRELDIDLVRGGLLDVDGIERFDMVHLSNIFDWSDDALVRAWAKRLEDLRPGAVITLRQLNNPRDLRGFLSDAFAFDEALGRELQEKDRSLFYERVEVGVRR